VVAEWERFPSLEGLDGYNAWGLSLLVPLPLGREGRQRKAVAGAEAAAADARIAAAGIELESRLRTARSTALEAEARLQVLEPVVAGLAATEHSLREQFRLGSITYLVFIDGLSRLDDVRVEYIDARAQLLMARLECAVLLGDDQYFPLTVLSVEEVPQ
jgi:outer membrane protein TolC